MAVLVKDGGMLHGAGARERGWEEVRAQKVVPRKNDAER